MDCSDLFPILSNLVILWSRKDFYASRFLLDINTRYATVQDIKLVVAMTTVFFPVCQVVNTCWQFVFPPRSQSKEDNKIAAKSSGTNLCLLISRFDKWTAYANSTQKKIGRGWEYSSRCDHNLKPPSPFPSP